MKILMVASEATPYAKTGGLADVIGALPFALQSRGDEVAVVLPLHRSAKSYTADAHRIYDDLRVRLGHQEFSVNIRRIVSRGVSYFFVESPELFDRPELYGDSTGDYPDNHIRFGVLCHAALGVVRRLFRPQVIHYHDWQGSLVGPILKRQFSSDPTFYGIKLLLTIHNLGYQGLFPKTALAELGLPPGLFTPSGLEFYGQVNLLKGGIVFADAINTVSRGYAREIQTPEFGFGLDGLLRTRSGDLTGIVNGVDYREWSPEVDPNLPSHYSVDDLSGKVVCKSELLRFFDLPDDDLTKPVIGIVSRFAAQKGFDLLAEIGDVLADEDAFLTVLGTGEPLYERIFQSVADKHPGNVGLKIGYDNRAAHLIEAGADIFLMPSRYEPCGLNQIYSLRYGTVPVVRATGGLDDTIDESTGFKFREYSGTALLEAIRTALGIYRNRDTWTAMMLRGMKKDYSWDTSAVEYAQLYRRLAG